MAKEKKKGKKKKDSGGPRDAVRGAVESTFSRAAGGAQELLDDVAQMVKSLRDANLVEALEGLRDEVQTLAKRVAALELKTERKPAPARPAVRRTTAAKKPAAARSTAAKKPAAARSTAARKPAATRSTAAGSTAAKSTGTRATGARSTAARKPARASKPKAGS